MPIIWLWTGTEITLTTMAIIQLWHPFLTYYGVWFVVMFFVGGCVGGSVTNTNYKIAEDFRKAGEPDEVRSFVNSYAGLGMYLYSIARKIDTRHTSILKTFTNFTL